MTSNFKNISFSLYRMIFSRLWRLIILLILLMFLPHKALFSQVISNSGAAITITPGAAVNSKDIENNTGSVENEGIIDLSGDYLNAVPSATSGNGLYYLDGDWTNLGTFSPDTSTVTFKGNTNQSILHGSGGETFFNLNIVNPGNIVTHNANPLSTLEVLNDLRIISGTLSLGSTTKNLLVDGKGIITGTLRYDNTTLQISSITGNLSGAGTIDMSGGGLSHLLNLSGASNSLGTLTTNPFSLSKVDYKGLNQTVFPSPNYRNLDISNAGTKTLQGNSIVGKNLNVKTGTIFHLGNSTTALDIIDSAVVSGNLDYSGISTKIVSVGGDLSGLGTIDMSGGSLSHLLNLYGVNNSIGSYISGTGATVDYIRTTGTGDQFVFESQNYRNLKISGSGVKTLTSDVTASGILTMLNGNINSNTNTLILTNPLITAIDYHAGTVIGKLQRAVNITGSNYLYPIGSASFYNPLKIKFQNLTSGPLTAQFKAEDIGNLGLPLDDDGNELWEQNTEGFWRLNSVPPMATSSYSVNLNYNGFTDVDSSSRIVIRKDLGMLELDGKNGLYNGTEIERDTLIKGLSVNSIDFGIVKGRPKIVDHPEDIDVCEGSDAFFKVKARGHGRKLTYQWQVDAGGGFINIINGGVYSGATSKQLNISPTDYSMNGYRYRVIVTDGSGNSNISNSALLTVNKIPIATATNNYQIVCDAETILDVVLGTSNNVTGTTFNWIRTNPDSILTLEPLSENGLEIGDIISGSFTNITDHPITIVYTITPTGPITTYCVGDPITVTLIIQPTPRIFPVPVNTIQCDSTTTSIQIKSPSTFTSGVIKFKYSVSATGGVTGFSTPVTDLPNNYIITDFLINPTTSVQTVTYTLTPVSPYLCNDGPSQVITVKVNPTPRLNALLAGHYVVCDTAAINISFTTGNPLIEGERWYYLQTDFTGSVSGVQPTAYYQIGTPIADILVNNTKDFQTINYRIKPVFRNTGGIQADCERGIDTLITITLNPTPFFDEVIMSDTVICNESFVSFSFTNSQLTTGTVIYELEGIYDGGSVSGVKPDGAYGLSSFTDTLYNGSVLIQPITYIFKPIISDPANSLYCNKGIYTSRQVKVNPTLLATATPSLFIGGRNIRCFGESTGTIDLAPTGGYYLHDYFYTWTRNGVPTSNPAAEDQSGLTIGNYKYRVEDLIGCFTEDSLILTQPDILTATDSIKPVSCAGKIDGEVYLSPTGGSVPYSYTWIDDDGLISHNKDLIGVRYGDHKLTMLDANLCQFKKTSTIIIPSPMLIAFDISDFGNFNVSCKGASDGSITTYALGNGSPADYDYLWINDVGTEVPDLPLLTGLTSANYYLTVIDSLNCEGSAQIYLSEPDPITITRTGTKYDENFDISCFDRSDGVINLSVSGGHTSYLPVSYDWTMTGNPGFSANTKDISTLRQGEYTVDVQDFYLCQQSASFTLIEPLEMILDTVAISDFNGYQVSCKGSSNSILDLNISGGFGAFDYTWTGSGTQTNVLDQSGLAAGNYHLDVVDDIGCPAAWDFEIREPDTIAVTPVIHINNGFEISCFDGSDGNIEPGPSGGVSPYQFNWTSVDGTGISQFAENQSGLSHGIYLLQITDNNACVFNWTDTLYQPEKLATVIVPKTISCFSTNNGAADLSVTGGVESYTYLWSNGETTEDIASLFTGAYYVDVTDANGCTISDTTLVTEPPDIIISLDAPLLYNGKMISCFGASDAIINSQVTGGVGSYRYDWLPNGEQTSGLTNIPAGLYKLTITDDNECTRDDSILVEQPLKLITEVYETNPTCFENTDGVITLIVQGGTPEYTIEWANGQVGQTADTIGVGTYNVVIRDLNQCRIDTFGILTQPDKIQISKQVTNPTCPDISDGIIQYQIQGGTQPYDLLLNNLRVDELISDLGEGKYIMVIRDNNQCVLTDTSDLKGVSPLCITVPNVFTPNSDGVNDTWVIDQIEIYPDVKIEIFNRWGELIYYAPNGYTKPWDGTFKGRELPIDSYFYVIDLNNGRDAVSGSITIIR